MRRRRRPQWVPSRLDLPGLVLAGATGGLAFGLSRVLPRTPYLSDVLIALGLGVMVLNTPLRHAVGLARPGHEREPDRYASGLRFAGKWILRAAIILMGLKVQTHFFGVGELALIAGIAVTAVPSAFFVAHSAAAVLKVRRPLADLLAGGTMICGASAVNAVAPVVGARREEQGIAIGTVFLFSVFALLAFRPIASWVGLDSASAGLWSGLAVNDLSSAIAVGNQMGGEGGVMAAASKSARILLLAPMLVVLSLLRGGTGPQNAKTVRKSALESIPRYLLGYVLLALLRAGGDRLFPASPAWTHILSFEKVLVDVLVLTVVASIGLHLELDKLLASGARALAVGGAASLWMASLTLAMMVSADRGTPSSVALIAAVALALSYALYRATAGGSSEMRRVLQRFEAGAPLSLAEATVLLDLLEEGHHPATDDATRRRLLTQLFPSIGELIPVRESPLPHGSGCRWITFWEGKSGWALVAVCREAGSETPIHAHPHRMLGKSIEGTLEELGFALESDTVAELTFRRVLGHGELVETDALESLHVVRAVGPGPAIDLQLRGPEVGRPGIQLDLTEPVLLTSLPIGARVGVKVAKDVRPGQGGEGASAGRVAVF